MPDGADREDRLERLIGRAKLVIAFERFWPPFVLALVVVVLFVACAWLGLWVALPRRGTPPRVLRLSRWASWGPAFWPSGPGCRRAPTRLRGSTETQGIGIVRYRRARTSWPTPMPTRPPARLWDLHRRRLAEAAGRVEVRKPSPRLVERDRFALRAAAVLALVASGFRGRGRQARAARGGIRCPKRRGERGGIPARCLDRPAALYGPSTAASPGPG